ncbi:probable 39S ribosomal protein L24, mitochondrial [Selaginella moellendorffii]|uniref:probable 39S ribosomal protein L24, mitochondrial n=1 Tax=Selaginella moellendorffii TaxID=88036 RepID=UPI000D1CAEE3|nr:probable 39S ribosomal protein L24, mitochondrial [Selaginella moellendorffii]|eukprot:XP_024543077.1 probable 39S ribosomal protein L24, mitochondrial [Selaginella moellendorffii]
MAVGFKRPIVTFNRWKILRGDKVKIITGNDKGLTGTVKEVFRKRNKVIVEGRNLVKRHVKRTVDNLTGVVTKESPIHVSNVMLVDPVSGGRVRSKCGFLQDGSKVRISVGTLATGSAIPRPACLAFKKVRLDGGPKNTLKDDVLERTYDPAIGLGIHPSRNFFWMYEPVYPVLPRFPPSEARGPRAYDYYRNLNQAPNRLPYTPSKREQRAARLKEKQEVIAAIAAQQKQKEQAS